MAKEYFDILDEFGNKTGKTKLRSEVHRDGDWHRAVHIWIVNNNGEVLLQRRSPNKDSNPNMLDISSAGHVTSGDNSIDSAVREIKEELNLDIKKEDLVFIKTIKRSTRYTKTFINNEFDDLYLLRTDKKLKDMKYQEEEISEIMYVPYNKLKEMYNNHQPDLLRRHDEDEDYMELFKIFDNKTDITIDTYNHIVKESIDYFSDLNQSGNIQLTEEINYLIDNLPDNATILDAGTGVGYYPKYLTERRNKNFKVIGIDAAKKMIDEAVKITPKAKFELMDLRDIKYEDNTFDCIICIATLIHINDSDCLKILDSFDRLLKDNGVILINVMDHTEGDKEIFVKEPFNPKYHTYYNRYSKKFFIDYFEKKNYVVKKILENKLHKEGSVGDDLTGVHEFTIIVRK